MSAKRVLNDGWTSKGKILTIVLFFKHRRNGVPVGGGRIYRVQFEEIYTFLQKKQEKIWSCQKKAVPLHSLSKRSDGLTSFDIGNGRLAQLV